MKGKAAQGGVILVTALLFLTVLLLLSMSILNTSLLQIKMSHNQQQAYEYFQAAESALRYAEQAVQENNFAACYYAEAQAADFFVDKTLQWWLGAGCGHTMLDVGWYYVVEKLAEDDNVYYYRITARAIDSKNMAAFPRVLQSTWLVAKTGVIVGRQSWRNVIS